MFNSDVLARLDQLDSKIGRWFIKMAGELDALKAQIEKTVSVEQGAITLLNGLKTELDQIIANNNLSQLVTLRNNLDAQTQALADAITANTPAS
jgi:hypothetical protein